MIIKSFKNLSENCQISNPDLSNYKIILILIILILSSIFINFQSRNYEKNFWEDAPEIYSAGGVKLVRSGDPAYYVGISKFIKENRLMSDYESSINFPTKFNNAKAPLLSKMIAHLSKDSSLNEIISSANKIVLFSSILTALGIFFLFFVINRPFDGVIASIGGGMSSEYYFRSGHGYIDTDILNLFFFYSIFALIYLSSRNQLWIKNIIWVVLAGALAKIFYLWYPKPEIIYLCLLSLFYFSTINTKDIIKILVNCIIFIIITDPFIYIDVLSVFTNNLYLSNYLSANVTIESLVTKNTLNFNNTFNFIGELRDINFTNLFEIEESIYLGLFCLTGLLLWAIAYPKIFLGTMPLCFFFLLSIFLGKRALFYSMPFMWFGFSYFINFLLYKFSSTGKILFNKNLIHMFSSMFIIIFIITLHDPFNRKFSQPWINNNIVKSMIDLGKIVKDRNNSLIVADWSYGYQSLMYNDIPILIHPGSPSSPRHYFISRAFTAFSLDETSKIINYVASGQVEKINKKEIDSFEKLAKDIYSTSKSELDIYLFLTDHQRSWINATGAVAYWDIEKNKPYYFKDKNAYDVLNFLEVFCNPLDEATLETKCFFDEGKQGKMYNVNLNLGLWDDRPILSRVVQITDQNVDLNEEYNKADDYYVFQIVKNSKNNKYQTFLLHEAIYKSSYNQLFHLNRNDNYELVYDNYPHVKIYKIN